MKFNQINVSDELNPQRYKTMYNALPTKGEVVDPISQTVPDQAMSVGEIMRRFASGLPLGGKRVDFYEGEDDMWDGVDPRTLDISEREEIIQRRVQELVELQQNQKDLSKRQAKKAQKDLEDKIRQQLKEQTGEDQDTTEP